MKIPPVLLFCLLPYVTIAEYDESATRKINLEDIEDDHIENERQSKSMPPPLSKQPAKGQPVQHLYPPLSNKDYPITNLFDTHRYSTRAHQHAHHVQPLTDQPTAPPPEAGLGYQQQQQSPTVYHGEQIVYVNADGHQQQPVNNPQQFYDIGQQQQQPAPHFYYSHDLQHQQSAGNGNSNENEYQLHFVPIEQHGGSDEQQQHQQEPFHGPSSQQVTVPSTAAPASVEPVSYSHDMTYAGVPQPEIQQQQQQQHLQLQQQQLHLQQQQLHLQQQQEPAQYLINNGIREPNYAQHVYGLSPDVLFQSQKDIQYAKPAENYGPSMEYFKKEEFSQRDYSQDLTASSPKVTPKPETSYQPEMSYSDQIKSVEYQNDQPSQLDSSSSHSSYQQNAKAQDSALSYGYETQLGQVIKSTPEPQTYYSNHKNGFKYNQISEEEKKPAISQGYENFPAPTAPSETQTYYLNHLKEIKSVHHAEGVQKPAITYGPPDTVGKEQPQIEYGVPDAPFRQPVVQSNQDIYAPRRPSSAGRSYGGKSFAVSFPYPPSFVSFTTEKSSLEKSSSPGAELSASNEVNPWRPIHGKPSLENHYRSFGQTSESIEGHQPIPDLFHTRRAKSLLDSYIPSWLVTRMQEEQSRQGQQGQTEGKHQSYSITSPQTQEDSYNTISYSSNENIYGNHFKRSVPKKKGIQKKKVPSTSNEEMTAME